MSDQHSDDRPGSRAGGNLGRSGDEVDPLDRLGGRLAHEPVDLGPLFERVRQQVQIDDRGVRGFLRSRSTVVRLTLAGLLFGVLSLLGGVGRPDIALYPTGRMLLVLAVLCLPAVAAVWVALRPLHRAAMPGWLGSALLTGTLAVVLGVYLLPAPHVAHAASVVPAVAGPIMHYALGCLSKGFAVGIPVYVLLRLLDRGSAAHAIMAALAAGLCANIAQQLNCPITTRSHLVLGHLGTIGIFLALHAILGRLTRRFA